MRINTQHRIHAFDRRMAAIHEAGHIVVAEHLGILSARGYIFPRPGVDHVEIKTWGGQTVFSANALQLRPLRRKMFAFAGGVAEHCWHHEPVDPYDFADEPAFLSVTDWEMVGAAPGHLDYLGLRAVERVAALLDPDNGPLWPHLCLTARGLILAQRDARTLFVA